MMHNNIIRAVLLIFPLTPVQHYLSDNATETAMYCVAVTLHASWAASVVNIRAGTAWWGVAALWWQRYMTQRVTETSHWQPWWRWWRRLLVRTKLDTALNPVGHWWRRCWRWQRWWWRWCSVWTTRHRQRRHPLQLLMTMYYTITDAHVNCQRAWYLSLWHDNWWNSDIRDCWREQCNV